MEVKIAEDFNGFSTLIDGMNKLHRNFINYKNKKYMSTFYRRDEKKIMKNIVTIYNNNLKPKYNGAFNDDTLDEIIEKFNEYIYNLLKLLFQEMYEKRCHCFFCLSSFKKFYNDNIKDNNENYIVETILLSDKISNRSILSQELRKNLAEAAGIHYE